MYVVIGRDQRLLFVEPTIHNACAMASPLQLLCSLALGARAAEQLGGSEGLSAAAFVRRSLCIDVSLASLLVVRRIHSLLATLESAAQYSSRPTPQSTPVHVPTYLRSK